MHRALILSLLLFQMLLGADKCVEVEMGGRYWGVIAEKDVIDLVLLAGSLTLPQINEAVDELVTYKAVLDDSIQLSLDRIIQKRERMSRYLKDTRVNVILIGMIKGDRRVFLLSRKRVITQAT